MAKITKPRKEANNSGLMMVLIMVSIIIGIVIGLMTETPKGRFEVETIEEEVYSNVVKKKTTTTTIEKAVQISSNIPTTTTTMECGTIPKDEVLDFALRNLGHKYKWGATREPLKTDHRMNGGKYTPNGKEVFDCMSLLVQAYRPYVNLPLYTQALKFNHKKFGIEVSSEDKQPGDIIVFKHRHVGLVLDDKCFIEAKSRKAGVVISPLPKPSKVSYYLRIKEKKCL